jgi:hypothetical protein
MQWTNPSGGNTGRRTDLENFMWTNGINGTEFTIEMERHLTRYCNDVSIHPSTFLDMVLDVQIRFMFHEMTNTWERFYLNFVNHPTAKTGVDGTMAYAELFCSLALRPGAGQGTTNNIRDTGVQRALRESQFVGGVGQLNRISFCNLNTRRERAATVYNQYLASQSQSQQTTQTQPQQPTIVIPPPPDPTVFAPYRIRMTGNNVNTRISPNVNAKSDGTTNRGDTHVVLEERAGPIDKVGTICRWGRIQIRIGGKLVYRWIWLGPTEVIWL